MTANAPARLFVLLAREALVGVILRRGPSAWVQMIHWDTKHDIFTPGQWFKGRVFGERCDLSPDGRLLVYFARRSGNSFFHSNYSDSWTAISRPPYFTALALWPLYWVEYGGGLFHSSDVVWLNHPHIMEPHEDHQPQGLEIIQDRLTYRQTGVLAERMKRDGWEPIQIGRDISRPVNENSPALLEWQRWDYWVVKFDRLSIWHRRIGELALEKHSWGYRAQRGEVYKYILTERRTNKRFDLGAVLWVDVDQQERLVLAKEGRIFSAILQNGDLSLTELANFNDDKPAQVETPDWARKW